MMNRIHSTKFLATLVCAAVALIATAAIALATPRATLSVGLASPISARNVASGRLTKCVSAKTYAGRKLEFQGTMNYLKPGDQMFMRFTVHRKLIGSKRATVLTGVGLNQWIQSSDPSATSYIRNLDVGGVETRAIYNARVNFRWVHANGKQVTRPAITTKSCSQTRALPDLTVKSLQTLPGDTPTTEKFSVLVLNRGAAGSSSPGAPYLSTTLSMNGVPVAQVGPVSTTPPDFPGVELLPRNLTEFLFQGPACAPGAGQLKIVVDPANEIRERSEKNNTLTVAC